MKADKKEPESAENEPEKRSPGRPTRLNGKIQGKICEILRDAGTYADAAKAVGVDLSTVMHWKQKGAAQESGKYREFLQVCQVAEEGRFATLEGRVVIASKDRTTDDGRFVPGDWRAAMAWLERKKPKEWAPRVYQHVDKELDGAIERLEREFKDEPAILDRALNAVAGGQSSGGAGSPEVGDGGKDDGGGEAVHPAPAVAEAASRA